MQHRCRPHPNFPKGARDQHGNVSTAPCSPPQATRYNRRNRHPPRRGGRRRRQGGLQKGRPPAAPRPPRGRRGRGRGEARGGAVPAAAGRAGPLGLGLDRLSRFRGFHPARQTRRENLGPHPAAHPTPRLHHHPFPAARWRTRCSGTRRGGGCTTGASWRSGSRARRGAGSGAGSASTASGPGAVAGSHPPRMAKRAWGSWRRSWFRSPGTGRARRWPTAALPP